MTMVNHLKLIYNDINMKVVGAIIHNATGELLLQLRDEHAPSYVNHWTLFGGIVEPLESPPAALLRELREELSLQEGQIKSMEIFGFYRQDNGTEQYIFRLQVTARIEDLTLHEGATMAFFSPERILDRPLAFNVREVLADYLRSQFGLAA